MRMSSNCEYSNEIVIGYRDQRGSCSIQEVKKSANIDAY